MLWKYVPFFREKFGAENATYRFEIRAVDMEVLTTTLVIGEVFYNTLLDTFVDILPPEVPTDDLFKQIREKVEKMEKYIFF